MKSSQLGSEDFQKKIDRRRTEVKIDLRSKNHWYFGVTELINTKQNFTKRNTKILHYVEASLSAGELALMTQREQLKSFPFSVLSEKEEYTVRSEDYC